MNRIEQYTLPLKSLDNGTFSYDYKLDDSFFALIRATDVDRGSLTAHVDVIKSPAVVELRFHISGHVLTVCDRCLGELKIPVETDERIFVKFGNAYSEESDELIIIPDSDGKYNIAWLMYEFIEMTLPMSHTHADGGCDEAMMTIYHRYSVDSCGEGAAHDGIKKGENKGLDPRWAALKNILDNN